MIVIVAETLGIVQFRRHPASRTRSAAGSISWSSRRFAEYCQSKVSDEGLVTLVYKDV